MEDSISILFDMTRSFCTIQIIGVIQKFGIDME